MGQELNNGIIITPLKIISNEKGKILHALKNSESDFYGFGEAYFSTIGYKSFKGWKKHREMILNIIVPAGAIRFYIIDDRKDIFAQSILLSKENYCRLTVPPGVWLGFEGIDKEPNILLNIASIPHDPLEAENKDMSFFSHLFEELAPLKK